MWPARRDERRLRLRGLTAFDSNSELRTLFRSHIAKRPLTEALCYVARPERFELPTPRFEAWCSIQLSYGRSGCHNRQGAKSITAFPC